MSVVQVSVLPSKFHVGSLIDICLPGKTPIRGMLSAWLNDMSYDVAISFYRRLNMFK